MAVELRQWRTPQYGNCSVCGKNKTVTKDGNITSRHAPCTGAGKPPAKES
jgi:hypothetical protein